MFLQAGGFKLSHSSSLIQVSVMEVLLYFFFTSGDSNIVLVNCPNFSCCMGFFSDQIALFSKIK